MIPGLCCCCAARGTCLTKSDQGPRNSSWQAARCMPVVVLSLEHHTSDSTIWLEEIPAGKEGMLPEPVRQVGLLYDRWRHHLFPPPQFRHETGGEGNIPQFPALVVSASTTPNTYGPTD
ncbi:hypothetical protein TNCV_479551 [Trichonephila clavipes]|nr:hypothetical protein TNCV_479551 [Trichonephila clavipes]